MSKLTKELFDALANERRRRILFDLVDRSSHGELPVAIHPAPKTTDSRVAASIELSHVHLPKLDEYDFIDWNPRTDTVETGPRFSEVRPILAQLCEHRAVVPCESE